MQIENVAITIHEAAELLREAVTAKLGADYPINGLTIMSYGKPLMSIQYDAGFQDGDLSTSTHRWEQYREVVHFTVAKP